MRRFFIIVAALVVAAACTNYVEQPTLPTQKQTISVGTEEDTRAFFESVDQGYRHYWEEGDALSVFYYSTANSRFALVGGAGSQQGTFEGEAAPGEQGTLYAVYPYSEQCAVSGSTLTVSYPSTQTLRTDKASYDKQALVMVSESSDTSIKMSNLSAFVRLSLTGSTTISKVELRALAGEPLAGSATVALGGVEYKPVITEGSNVVTLECNCDLSSTATELFFAVAPATLSRGFEVVVYDKRGYMRRRHTEATELARNTVYNMPEFAYKTAERAITLTGVKFAEKARVNAGYRYTVYATGFKSGDKIMLTSPSAEYLCNVVVYTDCVTFTIPSELVSGTYSLDVVRGSDSLILGDVELTMDSLPRADMLDVVFNADGTATDVSAKMMNIVDYPSSGKVTFYEEYQQCYMSRFYNNLYAEAQSGFYQIDFRSHNSYKAELADGHTMETIMKLSSAHDGSKEAKWFSCHDTGGTGFLLTDSSKGSVIAFLLRIGSEYKWALSNIVPQVGEYYHVVGVWNKESGQAVVYVNGVKYTPASASGTFTQPKNDVACWFAVGGDPKKSTAATSQNSWNGDVGMARIYDRPLTDAEVAALWNEAKRERPRETIQLSTPQFFSKAEVKEGSKYAIYVDGIQSGDMLQFASEQGEAKLLQSSVENGRIVATIPADMTSGKYRVSLARGNERCFVCEVELTVKANPRNYAAPQIIAHRGVCTNGEADNSMASLKSAQAIGGIYGSEFDIFTTSDGVIVLNHDKTTDTNALLIEDTKYEDLRNERLSNGESLPTLEAILEQGKTTPNLRLIVEVKAHKNHDNTLACTRRAVELIKAKGMENQVDFISFDYPTCQLAAELLPNITVGYLSADKTPATVFAGGVNNIDYKWASLQTTLNYVEDAHALGMTVNTWTVNNAADMLMVYQAGIDYLTTDKVAVAKEMYSKVFVEHP